MILNLEQYDKLNAETRDIQVKYYEMKQKYDEMNEKMSFLSKVSLKYSSYLFFSTFFQLM